MTETTSYIRRVCVVGCDTSFSAESNVVEVEIEEAPDNAQFSTSGAFPNRFFSILDIEDYLIYPVPAEIGDEIIIEFNSNSNIVSELIVRLID